MTTAFELDPSLNLTFYAESDLCVLYINHEYADMSNPRGEVHGYDYFVEACYPDGSRKRRYVGKQQWKRGEEADRAKALAETLNDKAARGIEPWGWGNPAVWRKSSPAYGSQAYVRGGGEANLIAWERDAEYNQIAWEDAL